MITIKDIARLAGVSKSTVSKALNDRPDVGEATQKKVLEIVKNVNFTPHAFGKALKKKPRKISASFFAGTFIRFPAIHFIPEFLKASKLNWP